MPDQDTNTLTSSGVTPLLSTVNPSNTLVPIDSRPVFTNFTAEVCRQLASSPGELFTLCIDRYSSKGIDPLDGLRAIASRVITIVEASNDDVQSDSDGTIIGSHYLGGPNDRMLVILSTTVSIAILGRFTQSGSNFSGGWTADRRSVVDLARKLLGSEMGQTVEFPVADADAIIQWTPQVTRLMTLFTRIVSTYQTAETVGRDDLLSVLDILKAISSRRRSHDVLYVFVEQIARTIQVDRCSVVRIWGTDDVGKVVASHDDAGIRDLDIELKKYPELQRSMELFEKVVVNDAMWDPLTKDCDGLKETEIRGILVVPIVLLDANVGSLFLRAVRKKQPFSPREVGFCEIVAEAASNALERAHLLERLQNANDRLERLAVTDELTGLHNHRYFRERFAEEFDRARRYGLPLSCIIFDIDNFKHINDEYGHLQGDKVLKEMAARTHRTSRRSDVLARYGGEEFVLIMPQTGVAGAAVQAERIRECIARPGYPGLHEDSTISVSLGVAELNHREMLDGESLIRAADTAMYEAKRSGKNCVVVANSTEN